MTLRQPLWCGPHHPTWPPKPDSWVMWVMPDFVKVGQVKLVLGISAMIHFQGHGEITTIPDAYMYWDPHPATPVPYNTLCPAAKPERSVPTPQPGQKLSVAQAAAQLGRGQKEIRRLLRAGKLEGWKEGSSWVGVDLASLHRLRQDEPPATD